MAETEPIEHWLRRLGLPQYTSCFIDNGIDLSVLGDLTDQDLEKLGVILGHRRKILRAAASMRFAEPSREIGRDSSHGTVTERRQLTVMFCDLVGSTRLSNMMDPEDYGELIRNYRKSCSQVIHACSGMVARFVGDGILAYFGYPQAHEDDPSRACRAGLGIIDALHGEQAAGIPLQARIACATGLVVVGDLVSEGLTEANGVVGATPNLSARLLTVASPG